MDLVERSGDVRNAVMVEIELSEWNAEEIVEACLDVDIEVESDEPCQSENEIDVAWESGVECIVGVEAHLCRLNDENYDAVVDVHLCLLNGGGGHDEDVMSMFEV